MPNAIKIIASSRIKPLLVLMPDLVISGRLTKFPTKIPKTNASSTALKEIIVLRKYAPDVITRASKIPARFERNKRLSKFLFCYFSFEI